MQDRFRFRVYYKPHNKVYNVICLNCDRQKEIIIEYKGSTAIVEWENCEIIQSTGLKDKNGKLIYEGDIVERENVQGKKRGVVEFNENLLHFRATNMSLFSLIHRAEVIGNIYENKDLLDD